MSKFQSLIVAAALSLAGAAQAATLTFDSAPDQFFIGSYSESGYVMTLAHADGLGTLTGNDGYWAGNGTAHLMTWSNIGSVSGFVLTRQDGGAFSLGAFDFGNGYVAGDLSPDNIVVTGTTATGGTVVTTIAHPSLGEYTYTFGAGWTNLTSVDFAANSDRNRTIYDNIVVNSVPEPESVALLLAGLGVVGSIRLKKAKAT